MKSKNSEKFDNSFGKNTIIYMNLPYIYKTPITLSLLKIVTVYCHDVYFNDFNILFQIAHHCKTLSLLFLNLTFNEHFLRNKRP